MSKAKQKLLLAAFGIAAAAHYGILFRLGYALRLLWDRYWKG